ncbi:MAG: glutathione S-transferase family protein [Hyphomicrobiaceae bacterium]
MKILEQQRAPNPRRVRIFLAEKGISVPFEPIDLAAGEHRSESFMQLNPVAQVPVLVLDDGTAISESVAICRYFEALQPEPSLMGATPLEAALIEMWNRRIEHGLFLAVTQCFRHTHPAMANLEVPQVAAWGEANRERAGRHLRMLDAELHQRPFIAGERFSIADITMRVAVDFMKPARIERPAGLSGLERWYAEVGARPSVAA